MKKLYKLAVYDKNKEFIKFINFNYIKMHNINKYVDVILDHNEVYNNILYKYRDT